MNRSDESLSERSIGAAAARIMVVIAVGVIVLAAIALIPGEGRVVRGLLQDQSSERLRELAANRRNGDADKVMLPYLGEQLSDEQWRSPDVFGTVLTMVSEAQDSAAVFESLKISSIPDAQKAAIAVTLAINMDASDGNVKTEVAAHLSDVLDSFIVETMPRTPEAVLFAVQAYRKASLSGLAWELMHSLVAEIGLDHVSAEFKRVYRDVAFETGHPGDGFAAASSIWKLARQSSNPDDVVAGKLDAEFDEFLTAARNSGEISPAVGALEERLAANAILQGDLSAVASAAKTERAAFEKYGLQLAQLCEWNSDPNRAFDGYARLAMLGNIDARTRCRVLQPGLFRGEELAEILLENEATIELEEMRELAVLVGNAGRTVEAKRVYQKLMAALPEEEADLQTTLGVLLDENGERKAALELLRKAYAAGPSAKTGAALGRVMVTSGNYEEALDHFVSMPNHDRNSASAYFHVAMALGDDAAAVEALEAKLAQIESPIVTDFAELAEVCSVAGQHQKADAAFRSGLEIFPDSRVLILRYVTMLGATGRSQEALTVLLGKKQYARDPAAVARLVELEIESSEYSRVLSWLGGEGVENRMALSNEGKALIADIYLQTGRPKQALAIIAGFPEEPRFAWMKAHAYFLNGRYREAERLQAQYIAGAGRTKPEAWRQLGRIRRVLGKERAARECFGMALSVLNKNLLVNATPGSRGSALNDKHGR